MSIKSLTLSPIKGNSISNKKSLNDCPVSSFIFFHCSLSSPIKPSTSKVNISIIKVGIISNPNASHISSNISINFKNA